LQYFTTVIQFSFLKEKFMSKETGGQAFPCLDAGGAGLSLRDGGMTLRDYFAAKAMSQVWSAYKEGLHGEPEDLENYLAKAAYLIARNQ
jgi:hypothetical protein